MKRSKRAALLSAVLLCCLCACGTSTETAARHSVALVVKSTNTEFWLSVFAGAEAAAAEYNLELTVAGPETEEDYAGAEALLFSAID